MAEGLTITPEVTAVGGGLLFDGDFEELFRDELGLSEEQRLALRQYRERQTPPSMIKEVIDTEAGTTRSVAYYYQEANPQHIQAIGEVVASGLSTTTAVNLQPISHKQISRPRHQETESPKRHIPLISGLAKFALRANS